MAETETVIEIATMNIVASPPPKGVSGRLLVKISGNEMPPKATATRSNHIGRARNINGLGDCWKLTDRRRRLPLVRIGAGATLARFPLIAVIAAFIILALPSSLFAQALSREAALQRCRATVGGPFIQSCMRAGGGSFATCRERAGPPVRACVQAALQRSGGGASARQAGGGPGGSKQKVGNRSPAGQAIDRARGLIQKQQYAAAIIELDNALKLDPKISYAYAWRGTAKQRMGQSAEALADFDDALELDPKNTLALTGRGYAKFLSRDFPAALSDLNASIAIDSSRSQAVAYRGLVYLETNEIDKALQDFNAALKLDPKTVPALNGLGGVYSRQKEYEKAIVEFGKSLQISPRNFIALNGRGFSYQSLGDNERALADFNAALSINPKFGRSYVNRGRILMDKGDYAAAIKDFDEANRYYPKNVAAALNRARAYELSRNPEMARSNFEAALTLVPNHPVALAGLERLKAKEGRADADSRKTAGRVALVIGNSKYAVFDTLANPERDAKLISETLTRSGFDKVYLVQDGAREAMADALKSFSSEASGADWAVVYFAGHGIELDGNNYLVPIDAKYEEDADIPKESVALDQVLNAVSGASRMRLVILDACRENPFAAARKTGEATQTGRGLARIEPESGTLVAFATKHGHLASDGSGANSPFASSLVRRIETPGLEINRLFRLVHDDVYQSTNKKQEPFTYGQLSAQEFYFRSR